MIREWLIYLSVDKSYHPFTNKIIAMNDEYSVVKDFVSRLVDQADFWECATIVSNEPYKWVLTPTTWACLGNAFVLYTTWDIKSSTLTDEPANIEYVFDDYSSAVKALESLNSDAYDAFVYGHICKEIV